MFRLTLKLLIFLAIPLVSVEVLIRYVLSAPFAGTRNLIDPLSIEEKADPGQLGYLFLGSSRVAAAIDTEAFKTYLAPSENDAISVVKIGRGYSTLTIYYQLLEQLLVINPNSLDDATIFIEAPQELPDWRTWQGNWIREERPELISPYLQANDLIPFWSQSTNSFGAKSRTTLAKYFHGFRYNDSIRNKANGTLDTLVKQILPPSPRQQPTIEADIKQAGGIRTDRAGILLSRQIAGSLAREELRDRQSIENWNQSVLASLIELVENAGGQIILFEMPLSSVQSAAYETPEVRAIRTRFHQWREANTLVLLEPNFSYTDEDFPDLAHLRSSRAAEFTQRIAQAYEQLLISEQLEQSHSNYKIFHKD